MIPVYLAGRVCAAIALPLGEVNPSVAAAWIICTRPIRIPIFLIQEAPRRENAYCKYHTDVMPHQQSNIFYDEDIKLKICLVLCMNGCQEHLLQNLPVKNMQKIYLPPSPTRQNFWKSHFNDDDDDDDVMMTMATM